MDECSVFGIADRAKELIDKARNGKPSFMLIDTQRSHVHCGVDKEFELENDPLDFAKDYNDTEIKARIIAAFDAAELAPLPTPSMASKYVYA